MSLLFFRRMLAHPLRVGYLVPSSPFLTRRTAARLDFSSPRTVVEIGPGEGCHSRKILRRMGGSCRLALVEKDPAFAEHLRRQFAGDRRVKVIEADARHLRRALAAAGVARCDYILSGLPFALMGPAATAGLLAEIAGSMDERTEFLTYQVSLRQLEPGLRHFRLAARSFCLWNIPPVNLFVFRKA
ncbi:MAG: 16S rRNA (cytosine(1402)-N(4))-methyltransferase [Terrimicrobiaceae bacterium]|nr:16S rRNA (cytosine(1402)-N(4))-methyltransferase [Terrimicrobiaceae bacterium]